MNQGLSIVIPTYNRWNSLLILLKTIIPLSRFYKISVLILDNNSSDLTQDVCAEIVKKHAHIKYFRNHVNIGMELNILRALSLANTSHVWCIGDDDELSVDILDLFYKHGYMKNILSSDATFIINHLFGAQADGNQFFFQDFAKFAKHFFLSDFEVLTGITWISGVIVKKSLINASTGILSLNQNFVHTHSYLSSIINSKGNIMVIPQKLVKEQKLKMSRSKDSESYLDQTFQRSLHNILIKIAKECHIECNMNYEKYIQKISLRYSVPPSILIKGERPWSY